jgi:hypothetical protein
MILQKNPPFQSFAALSTAKNAAVKSLGFMKENGFIEEAMIAEEWGFLGRRHFVAFLLPRATTEFIFQCYIGSSILALCNWPARVQIGPGTSRILSSGKAVENQMSRTLVSLLASNGIDVLRATGQNPRQPLKPVDLRSFD